MIILRPSDVDNLWFFGMVSWEKEVHMQAHHTADEQSCNQRCVFEILPSHR